MVSILVRSVRVGGSATILSQHHEAEYEPINVLDFEVDGIGDLSAVQSLGPKVIHYFLEYLRGLALAALWLRGSVTFFRCLDVETSVMPV